MLYLTLVGLVVACGPTPKPKKKKTIVKAKESVGIPYKVNYSSQSCSKFMHATPPKTDLYIRGQYSDVSLQYLFKSNIYSDVKLGGKYKNAIPEWFHLIRDKVVDPVDFKLCRTLEPYKDKTYEDAAVSALYPLLKFEKQFYEIIEKYNPSEVELNIQPEIAIISDADVNIKVNNAYYYSNVITFLPQGVTRFEGNDYIPFGGVPLWKIPMVVMHEYGHHLFATIFYHGDIHLHSDESIADVHDSGPCFNPAPEGEILASEIKKRTLDKNLARRALNEGFADIFAYYGSEEGRSLLGLGCFTNSRDVESHIFRNGDLKKLNADALKEFLNEKTVHYSGCGTDVDFQDIHIVGAVYAHAIHTTLNKLVTTDEQKLEFIFDWVAKIGKSYLSYKKPEQVLAGAVNAFIEVLRDKKVYSTYRCQKMQGFFPGLTLNECK